MSRRRRSYITDGAGVFFCKPVIDIRCGTIYNQKGSTKMDDGIMTLIGTVATIIVSVVIALIVLTRQSNRLEEQMRENISELRAETREAISELRAETRDLANRFGERISDVEREQARLDGANSVMRAQAHTHAPPTALEDD